MPVKQYYTECGERIRNPEAYAATGAPMYDSFTTREGKKVYNPEAYVNAGGELYVDKNINEERSVYEIKCRGGKRYVGETGDYDRRMEEHFTGNGAKVTQKYKPISTKEIDIVPGYLAKKVEQEHTDYLIDKLGYDRVRGGKYTNSHTLTSARYRR